MLKILEKVDNKNPIHILTRSPNQYSNYKTGNGIKAIDKYKGSVVFFDDMFRAPNRSQIDELFTRGRLENLDVYYNSKSYFSLPRPSNRKNSGILILFKQRLRDVHSMCCNIWAFDMKKNEFKEMCRRTWSEKINCLCIDMTKNEKEGKNRIFKERKNTLIELTPETEAF